MMRKPYPTDLTDKQWNILEPLIPSAKTGGRLQKLCVMFVTILLLSRLRYKNLPEAFGAIEEWKTKCIMSGMSLRGRIDLEFALLLCQIFAIVCNFTLKLYRDQLF